VPQFYLRAAMETKPRLRLAAVCYRRIESNTAVGHFKVLLTDEWGEKEILRKLKDMGLFELGEKFVPIGPHLEADLSLIFSRAVDQGILALDEKATADSVLRKLSQSSTQRAVKMTRSAEHEQEPLGKDTNKHKVERLCREGESFLREYSTLSE